MLMVEDSVTEEVTRIANSLATKYHAHDRKSSHP